MLPLPLMYSSINDNGKLIRKPTRWFRILGRSSCTRDIVEINRGFKGDLLRSRTKRVKPPCVQARNPRRRSFNAYAL
eukprot:1382963-Pyramimonas_sp.AAC.1